MDLTKTPILKQWYEWDYRTEKEAAEKKGFILMDKTSFENKLRRELNIKVLTISLTLVFGTFFIVF